MSNITFFVIPVQKGTQLVIFLSLKFFFLYCFDPMIIAIFQNYKQIAKIIGNEGGLLVILERKC